MLLSLFRIYRSDYLTKRDITRKKTDLGSVTILIYLHRSDCSAWISLGFSDVKVMTNVSGPHFKSEKLKEKEHHNGKVVT